MFASPFYAAAADAAPKFSFVQLDAFDYFGEEDPYNLVVALELNKNTKIVACTVEITFDNSLLKLVSCEKSPGKDYTACGLKRNSKNTIGLSYINDIPDTEGGQIAVFIFRASKFGVPTEIKASVKKVYIYSEKAKYNAEKLKASGYSSENFKTQNLNLEGIEVTKPPSKTVYDKGNNKSAAVDKTGMEVAAWYSGGRDAKLPSGSYTVSTFDSRTAGEKRITVTYGSFTDEFYITVKDDVANTANPGGNGSFKRPGINGPAVNLKKGDVNGDGEIDAADARLVLRHVAKLQLLAAEQLPRADASGDGEVDAADARLILRVVAKLQTL
ncbi:MAG: dockerin type I domain-containing protein [Oscillospiraceae bacterium]|nr:dockerin type I domain-containing protein [Oscillospiraceae bacterium]